MVRCCFELTLIRFFNSKLIRSAPHATPLLYLFDRRADSRFWLVHLRRQDPAERVRDEGTNHFWKFHRSGGGWWTPVAILGGVWGLILKHRRDSCKSFIGLAHPFDRTFEVTQPSLLRAVARSGIRLCQVLHFHG